VTLYDATVPTRTLERAVLEHRGAVVDHEPEVRRGEDPEAVHKQRVASRRLRSLLRTARSQLDDPERSEQLRDELRWLGNALGEVRDRDVLIAYLQAELATLEEASAFRGVLKLLDDERELARGKLVVALDSQRYQRLLKELETPPSLNGGLRAAAVKEHKRLRKAVKRMSGDPTDEELHKVRIRAKRARYAAEASGAGKRYIKRAKSLQDVLGEHQDAAVAEQRIRRLLSRVRPSRRTALAAGRLIERQRARRAAARREWPKAWKRLDRAGDAEWR
jgi:CHAD domain-containing protein